MVHPLRLLGSSVALAIFVQPVVKAELPTVIAVDGVLCDLTRTLVSSSATVTCLIPPGGDPHNYRLRPSDRKALAKASLVLHNGFNLTPSANKMSGSAPVVAVGEQAIPSYSGQDPHVWHDPANSEAMVKVVTESLKDLLPPDERIELMARASLAEDILRDVGTWAAYQFNSLPPEQRILVSEHQAYSHLASRYGLHQITMLDSFTTGGVLRPSSLRKITTEVKGTGAKTLFPESLPASKTLRRISRSTGLPVYSSPLYPDGLAPGRSSIATATLNICTVVNGQGGQCDQVTADELVKRWASIR